MGLGSSSRRPAAVAVCAASLAMGLTGCGADGAQAGSQATSGASPSPSRTPAADSGQPTGRYGVTYEIQGTDKNDDVLVAGYKLAFEAFGGSVNTRQVTSEMQSRFTKPLQRTLVGRIQFAWSANLHVDPIAKVRVLSSNRQGDTGSVTVCHWVDSTDFKTEDDALYGEPEPGWEKVDIDLVQRQKTWRVATIESVGRCPGGSPR